MLELRDERAEALQLEAREVDAVQRSEDAEQIERRLEQHVEPPELRVARRERLVVPPQRKELPVMLDARTPQLVRVRRGALAPAGEQLLAVQRPALDEPESSFCIGPCTSSSRTSSWSSCSSSSATVVYPTWTATPPTSNCTRCGGAIGTRFVPAERLAQQLEPVVGRRLVDIEEQVDVGEEVGVAPRPGARQQCRAQRPELERSLDDAAGERPNVLRRGVHLRRIVDSRR